MPKKKTVRRRATSGTRKVSRRSTARRKSSSVATARKRARKSREKNMCVPCSVNLVKLGVFSVVAGSMLFLALNYFYFALTYLLNLGIFEMYGLFVVVLAALVVVSFFVTELVYMIVKLIWDSILEAPKGR